MSFTASGAAAHYEKAYAAGLKQGGAPAVLTDILAADNVSYPAQYPLGVMQIPLEQVAGTYTKSRSDSFSSGFYPKMEEGSEFADKWKALCRAHLEEGIHTPVKAYEYMNLYYIVEGNKRVSVLKYFDADSIAADVTRIMPPIADTEAVRVNYEYIDFFHQTGINYIYFRTQGCFHRLMRLVGKSFYETWSDDDRADFNSVYTRFRTELEHETGHCSYIEASTAFLTFLALYDYAELKNMSVTDLRDLVLKSVSALELAISGEQASIRLDPSEAKAGFLQALIPVSRPSLHLRAAFLQHKSPEESGWSRSHERARLHLQKVFGNEISTFSRSGIGPDEIGDAVKEAVSDGTDLIFTTSSVFLKESIRSALEYPTVKILNCSLNKPQKAVRTYYARMYEVKFLMGAIAATLAENHRLGFIADFPIYGTIAGINAFALGAQMIDPKVKVYLNWSCIEGVDLNAFLWENEISVICGKDSELGTQDHRYGLYRISEGSLWNIAVPVWNWSVFYEKIIRSVLDGTWKSDEPKGSTQGINYWWGMSSGIVNLIYSRRLPTGTLRLVRSLRDAVAAGTLHPFSGPLLSQDGRVRKGVSETLSPEEIIGIDWLADNVIGSIPEASELDPEARLLADYQSVRTGETIL
ncbi:MAG: BMP family ABC transporter substrate-binding protein [Lachnospiraceae bacterium]|nr:BMP family ABC transporter substrate-binding protein [Lachnospiraceae bacterium]